MEGWTLAAAAAAAGVSLRCARKWVGRYRREGEAGLCDRSSAPRQVANRTPADRVAVIVLLRGLRFTAAEIAETLGLALSTVSGILTQLRLRRLRPIGIEPPHRYERSRPGELVHVDVKRLSRIQDGAGKRAFGGERRLKHNPRRRDREPRRPGPRKLGPGASHEPQAPPPDRVSSVPSATDEGVGAARKAARPTPPARRVAPV